MCTSSSCKGHSSKCTGCSAAEDRDLEGTRRIWNRMEGTGVTCAVELSYGTISLYQLYRCSPWPWGGAVLAEQEVAAGGTCGRHRKPRGAVMSCSPLWITVPAKRTVMLAYTFQILSRAKAFQRVSTITPVSHSNSSRKKCLWEPWETAPVFSSHFRWSTLSCHGLAVVPGNCHKKATLFPPAA